MSEPTARSYRPGSWFGIFGDHATVLLPPSEKERVPALWELVDEGAGFDEVLDALISGGLRRLPGFVLVSELDADTKVVIRGAARARFTADGEPVELEGSLATTWVERTLTSVTAMTLEVDEPGETGELTVGNGLVRLSRVTVPPYDDGDGDAGTAGTAGPEGPEAPAVPPVPDLPEPPLPDGPVGGPPDPAPAVAPDHDGMTRAGAVDPGPFSPPPPGIPGQPPAPAVLSRPVARLVFSSGETVGVDRAIVVGRAPEARRFPASDQPRLVTVPSPQQEISSTHLELRPGTGADHGSAVVTDLGSTNGTVVVQPGLPPEDLRPGIAVQLIPGAIIDLGDGVTIQVLNP